MTSRSRVLVTGAGGFIGHSLVAYLRTQGYWVRGVDTRYPEFRPHAADEFALLDLRQWGNCLEATRNIDEVYALAADTGGSGFFASHRARTLHNNLLINLYMLQAARTRHLKRYLHVSSAYATIDPQLRQSLPLSPAEEETLLTLETSALAYRLIEQLCRHYRDEEGLATRVVRLHNIFGPYIPWEGGRERVVAALCRKIAIAKYTGQTEVEIWGNGEQVRSFCYIDDCVAGLHQIMTTTSSFLIALGNEPAVTINQLADMIAAIAGVTITKRYIPGPEGRHTLTYDSELLRQVLGWQPQVSLEEGLRRTYPWIEARVHERLKNQPPESSPLT